jgi:hypothetical protein
MGLVRDVTFITQTMTKSSASRRVVEMPTCPFGKG